MIKPTISQHDDRLRSLWTLYTTTMLMTTLCGGAAHAASVVQAPTVAVTPDSVTSQKKIITHDVYANWRSIQHEILSRDGQWAAYALIAQEADGEVVFRHIKDAREWRVARGTAPAFSADGRYAAFAIKATQLELDQAKKANKKADELPKSGLGIIDLQTGIVQRIEHVRQFAWPEEGGDFLAVLSEPVVASKNSPAVNAVINNQTSQTLQIPQTTKTEIRKTLVTDPATAPVTVQLVDALEVTDVTGVSDAADQSLPVADSKKKMIATELTLIDIAQNRRTVFQNVTEFAWAKNGSRLSFSVNNKNKEVDSKVAKNEKTGQEVIAAPIVRPSVENGGRLQDGVYVVVPSVARAVAVITGAGSYKSLRFDDAGEQLAFISNREQLAAKNISKENTTQSTQSTQSTSSATDATQKKETIASQEKDKSPDLMDLYYWRDHQQIASVLVSRTSAGMPVGWSVNEYAEIGFSKDGQRLFLGTSALPLNEAIDAPDAPEAMKVDLWHWQDPELQSMQKVKAEKEKQRSYKAVVHIATQRFVQLATPQIPQVMVNENAEFAMGISDVPYQMLQSWDALYRDAYAVNLNTGDARLLIKKSRFLPGLSPAGKYLFVFDAASSQWLAWTTKEGTRLNLTGHIRSAFFDHEQDTPEPRSAYGYAGWTADDQHFVAYDQFDLWEINPLTNASRMLTQGYGRQHQLQLRYIDLLAEKKIPAEEVIPVAEMKALPQGRWLLSATHQLNRSTGFYQQDSVGNMPVRLLQADNMFGNVSKAKQAETLLYTRQSFTEFPDLWASDLQLQAPQKISNANPQQTQYNWGTQELMSYTSADGKKLKALLAKPENFDPSKKYPMMVYIYEKMSDNLHRYVPPAPSQNINVTRYLSNGYIVLRPDIVYQTGHPGKSAMRAVIPAVKKVLALSYVDPARVGIQGHSWGAYQINYMITQTNMFRAAEAGASMANMISGYGGIRWGKGMSRAFQYETGQSRIGGTPWNKTAEFIENSPIFYVDKVQTPYLTKHNDDDDAVPWYQAIEFFTAMRRLGKEAYWFNYNGEKHGLKDRDHVKHYTVHMAEFFDHFLLGQPRPEWMIKPIPYLERGKRDVMGMFKPPVVASEVMPVADVQK
ncbi:alpha/beta hydrolase family protein [Undibacterium sp. SXout7W]|uniref:alpha/beta hydrolase family protein n=1 Tax=Undibacterium sp. SXout7W TaxID=3413049 RepID=UPI003BF26492